MTIDQFVKKYNMHDSLIESVSYDKNTFSVTVKIDFAFWMQTEYIDSDPETGILTVQFINVSSFTCDEDIDFSMTSILEMSNIGHTVTFLILNDFTDEDYEIIITAESVDVSVGDST